MRNLKLLVIMLIALAVGQAQAYGFRTGQVSVGTGSASEIGSTTDRNGLNIFNADTANPVYCGNSSAVTSSTGLRVGPGIGFTLDSAPQSFTNTPAARASFYCIATGGTVSVSFLEDVK